jgi:hypothetical protein
LGESRAHADGNDAGGGYDGSIADHLILLMSFKLRYCPRGSVAMLKPAFSLL